MEGCDNTWFKQRGILEFLTMDNTHHHGLISAQLHAGYSSLSKKQWGKQVCVTKQGQRSQDGFQELVKCWHKCIEVGGENVEK